MATITKRATAKEDVTVLSIDGNSVVGIFRTASMEITADEIDLTAAQDTWKQREFGTLDWRMTCSTLVSVKPQFIESIISGGTIVVQCVMSGFGTTFSFLGTGMITGTPLNIDNPVTQDITIVSAGASPTVTF